MSRRDERARYGQGSGADRLLGRDSRQGRTCGLDFKYVAPGEGLRDGWGRAWCGRSCYDGWQEFRRHSFSHIVPDPRYHRAGDGWRRVVRWIRAALPMGHVHRQHRRRERRAPGRAW